MEMEKAVDCEIEKKLLLIQNKKKNVEEKSEHIYKQKECDSDTLFAYRYVRFCDRDTL